MRTKKYDTEKALFLRYITSYLVILLIPTLIFTVFISGTLINNLKEKYISETIQTMEQNRIVMEKNILQTQEVRDQLLTGNRLIPTLNVSDVLAAQEIIKELKKFVTANGFFLDVALYFRGDSYIYNSLSSHELEKYLSDKMGNQIWDYETFLAEESLRNMREIKKSQNVTIDGMVRDMITVVYPVTFRNTHATLIFFVDSRFLRQSETGDALFVVDEKGKLLFADGPIELVKRNHEEFSEKYYASEGQDCDAGSCESIFAGMGEESPVPDNPDSRIPRAAVC